MLESLFWIAVGAFIGWNLPQPMWAKNFQEKYLTPAINKIKFW